jgi:hypothetical protein
MTGAYVHKQNPKFPIDRYDEKIVKNEQKPSEKFFP